MIENCVPENIKACSVDLRLNRIFKTVSKDIIDLDNNMPKVKELKLPYVLKPNEYVLGASVEKFKDHRPKYSSIAIPRSRAFRIGLSIQCGLTDPYYEGELIFGIKNISEHHIRLKQGISIVQLVFFDIKSDCVPLKAMYQHGRVI